MLDEARSAMARLASDCAPVVTPRNVETIVNRGARRWTSYARRCKGARFDPKKRVEDLAKGLLMASETETDRHLIGQLIEDYRHLAAVLGSVFERYSLGTR